MSEAPIKIKTTRGVRDDRRDLIIVGPRGWATLKEDLGVGVADSFGRQYANMLDVPFEPFQEMPR